MADLAKIFTGMDKGPEVIDQNFGILNADVEGKITVHDWSEDGLVYANGFYAKEAHTEYRYVELANQVKIVDLFLSVWGAANTGDQQVLTLPDTIALPNGHWKFFSSWGKGHLEDNKVIYSASSNGSNGDHCIVASLTYIAK